MLKLNWRWQQFHFGQLSLEYLRLLWPLRHERGEIRGGGAEVEMSKWNTKYSNATQTWGWKCTRCKTLIFLCGRSDRLLPHSFPVRYSPVFLHSPPFPSFSRCGHPRLRWWIKNEWRGKHGTSCSMSSPACEKTNCRSSPYRRVWPFPFVFSDPSALEAVSTVMWINAALQRLPKFALWLPKPDFAGPIIG